MLKPKKSVENMNGYYVPMYEKEWDIKIDSNENNYGPSPLVLKALGECDLNNISFYPFYGELSQKIANYQNIDINNIKVTNGADEALQAIIQTYLEPQDILLTLDSSFDMPIIYTNIQGGEVIKVEFDEKWVFPIEKFIQELDNPKIKIVYLASPNNPTGNIISEVNIEKILEKAKDKVIIIDETYANYAEITYKKFLKDFDNLFIVHSFSKDFALAGMRLGYIISHEANIKNLKKVVSPFSVNAFAMRAGIAALDDIKYFDNILQEIKVSREELSTFFQTLGATVYKSHANFILVDFKEKAEFVHHKLKQANITVKLFKKGHLLENHLRITIPTKDGVKKIKEVLQIKPSLVFDMDGVLIDASNSYRETIAKTFEKFTEKTVSKQEIQAAKNLGGLNNDWDLTKYLLEKEGYNIPYQEIVDTFQEIYWKDGKGLINNETMLFDKNFFEKLSKDYNLSIFTGRLRQEAMYALERFKVADLFFPIITTNDVPFGEWKPSPYGLNKTKEMTISSSYYYFGDTTDDILAAKSAKYIAIGVLPPQDKSQELVNILKEKGADDTISTINDLLTIMEQSNEAIR